MAELFKIIEILTQNGGKSASALTPAPGMTKLPKNLKGFWAIKLM